MKSARFLYFSKKFRTWHETELKIFWKKQGYAIEGARLKQDLDSQLTNTKANAKIE